MSMTWASLIVTSVLMEHQTLPNQSINLMAVMKLSTCHHKSSRNKLQTIVFDGEINHESSHSCARFSAVCIYIALKKWSAYHHRNREIIVITIMNNFCQDQLFDKLLTSMFSHGSHKTEHVIIRILRI